MRKLVLKQFKRSGLSIKALSDRSGVRYSACHAVIRGDRDPQLSTVEKLSDVLGLELKPKSRRSKRIT